MNERCFLLGPLTGSNCLKLLEEFAEHPSPAVRAFGAKEKVRIGDAIRTDMRTEIQFDRETHERFG